MIAPLLNKRKWTNTTRGRESREGGRKTESERAKRVKKKRAIDKRDDVNLFVSGTELTTEMNKCRALEQ